MDKDQRKFDRIEIPESFVNLYIGNGRFSLFPNYSRNFPLINLTKSGLCFRCEKQLSIGQELEIRLKARHLRPLRLKVKVLWSELDENDYQYNTGVRIKPYGSMTSLNSMRSLHRLKELEITHTAII